MSTGSPIPDHIRAAAIADYQTSGESMLIVSRRHGVSKTALADWISPRAQHRIRDRAWSDAEIAYRGGWEVRGGVRYPLLPESRSA